MADNVAITPGSGVSIATDDVSGAQYQRFKMDIGGDGVSVPVVVGGSNGVPAALVSSPATGIYIRPAAGETFPVSIAGTVAISAAAAITVQALVTAPVFVRLSDGTNPIATLPVSGTVAVTQGTAAAASGAWFQKITDGTSTVGISSVGGDRALKVDVIQSVTSALPEDSDSFTAGTTRIQPIAGVYDDGVAAPSSGQTAAVRLTANRGLHVSLRAAAGTEIGSSGAPLRVDPVGTTDQPVRLRDTSGNPFTDANPLPVSHSAKGRTRVTKSVTLTATTANIWTPTSSTRFNINRIELCISVAGDFELFDQTSAAGNRVINSLAAGLPAGRHVFDFTGQPWVSATVDNILKYTAGGSFAAIITVHGFETT